MSERLLAILGITAGVLNVVALIPYIRDILRGNTKPERATFWVWLALSVVGFLAQWTAGARWSLVLSFSSMIVVAIVAILSVQYGYGKFHMRDGMALIVTAVGIVWSYYLNSPLFAVSVIVLIDAIGGILTLHKTWYAPKTENLFAWSISMVAAICGLLAVGQFHPAIFLSPLCNMIINVLIVFIITYRNPKVKLAPADI